MPNVCPLRMAAFDDGRDHTAPFASCIEARCAWWNVENERCQVGIMAEWLGWMSEHVKKLAESVHQERAELLKTAGEL
jgi:hypothetical protein